MELRPYQQDCLHKIKSLIGKDRHILVKIPCGGGKTFLFANLIKDFLIDNPGKRALVLVNKIILVDQTKKEIEKVIPGNFVGVVCGSMGESDIDSKIVVATIQTINRHSVDFDLVIVDEAHRSESGRFTEFLASQSQTIVYFTATPYTSSGYIYGELKNIKYLAFEMSIRDAQEMGILLPIIFKQVKGEFDTSSIPIIAGDFNLGALEKLASDVPKVTKQVTDALTRMTGREKIVWACIGVDHAALVYEMLQSAGETVSIIHSKMSKEDRHNHQSRFENDKTRHLVSINIVSEGFNLPKIDCVVIMRPTRSHNFYTQLVGRALRTYPGQTNALCLDYGEVVKNLGDLDKPVFKGSSRKLDKNEIKFICPQCEEMFFYIPSSCRCGYTTEKEQKASSVKNTTEQAWVPKDIENKNNEMLCEVLSWKSVPHISKAGKSGIKVIYNLKIGPDSVFGLSGSFVEYFSDDNYYTRKFKAETDDGNRMPKRIVIKKDGQWWKTVKREYF